MAPRLVQSSLDISDTGHLIFVSPLPPLTYPYLRPGRPSSKLIAGLKIFNAPNARILQLPDEILQQFFEAVADLDARLSRDDDYYNQYYYSESVTASSHDDESEDDSPQAKSRVHIRYEAIHALVLTCRRFHTIAVPMLYAKPHFEAPHLRQDDVSQCEKFYDTIKRNPPLRLYVKHLSLVGKCLDHELVQICFPHLKSLKLAYCTDKDGEAGGGGPRPEEEGTAGLNELRLCQVRFRPRVVKRILKWPHLLYVFALDDITYDGYGWEYTEPDPAYRWSLTILTDVLAPQRLNLQVLQLGWMGYTRDQNRFNVSLFPKLHTLQLCIAYEKPDEVACQNWLTATLRTMVLDLGKNDSQGGKRSNFDSCERKTAIDFARLASEEKKQRPGSVGLTEIGFLAHNIGDDSWDGDSEWLCHHAGWDCKTEILKTLKAIEAYGFSAFWIGASGARHTVKMIEQACTVCAGATSHVGERSDSRS